MQSIMWRREPLSTAPSGQCGEHVPRVGVCAKAEYALCSGWKPKWGRTHEGRPQPTLPACHLIDLMGKRTSCAILLPMSGCSWRGCGVELARRVSEGVVEPAQAPWQPGNKVNRGKRAPSARVGRHSSGPVGPWGARAPFPCWLERPGGQQGLVARANGLGALGPPALFSLLGSWGPLSWLLRHSDNSFGVLGSLSLHKCCDCQS